MHPLPATELQKMLANKKRIIDIEDNYDAQLAGVITQYALVKPNYYIQKYTGTPHDGHRSLPSPQEHN